MIELQLFTILTFLIGYYLGTKRSITDDLKSVQHYVHDVREQIEVKSSPVGVVKRPDALTLSKWNEDPKVREAKAEMKKALDQIPELAEAKKHLEKRYEKTN